MNATTLSILTVAMLISCVNGDDQHEILCSREGAICVNCETRGYCVKKDAGFSYNPEKEERCVAGWVCDELSLACVRKGTCRYKAMVCPENDFDKEVAFPDPYSCNGFVGCQGPNSFFYKCPNNGTAYDPVKKDCSASTSNTECYDYPVLCEEYGQKIVISNISYECVGETDDKGMKLLYPKIIYSDVTSTTTQPTTESTAAHSSTGKTSESTSNSTSSGGKTNTASPASSNPTTNTTAQPASTPTTTSKPYECNKEGNFKDPQDCTKFYKCQKDGGSFVLTHNSCRRGSHFDSTAKGCVRGSCTTVTHSINL